MLYVFTKNNHDQSDSIFKNMAWIWLSLWKWKIENNGSKACIMMPDGSLKLQTMSLKHAYWWYFKRFGTSEKNMKAMFLKHALWWDLRQIGTAGKKPRTVNGAIWRYLKRFGTFYVKTYECSLWYTFMFDHLFQTICQREWKTSTATSPLVCTVMCVGLCLRRASCCLPSYSAPGLNNTITKSTWYDKLF